MSGGRSGRRIPIDVRVESGALEGAEPSTPCPEKTLVRVTKAENGGIRTYLDGGT